MTKKRDRVCRFNLEVPPNVKADVQREADRTGLSMTQVMLKAWFIYRLVQQDDIRRHSDGEWIKMEIL